MSETIVSKTFAVSDVRARETLLPEMPYPEAIAQFVGGPVESCSRYHGKLVANVMSHPLIAALHAGFAYHYPVCLSPDILWLTITQGLAIHINQNAERLRSKLVSHEGQLTLKVRRDDFIKGSPENPWPEVFSAFSEQIHDHIGDAHDLIVADFSTTGPAEKAASEIVLLDSMQSYFTYELSTRCGIPAIKLEGTVGDWESIVARVEQFARFDLDPWLDAILPILRQFVRAAKGEIDREHWESIYKYQGPRGSGSPFVSGWVTRLFPYLRNWQDDYEPNQWLSTMPSHYGPNREAFPNTTSRAPLKWKIDNSSVETIYEMELCGGLIGVSQDRETRTVRPEIGWAVREAKPIEKQDMTGSFSFSRDCDNIL